MKRTLALLLSCTIALSACSLRRADTEPEPDPDDMEGSFLSEMRSLERVQLANHPSIARRDGGRLTLTLKDGRTKVFEDVFSDEHSEAIAHSFDSYLPSISYVVLHLLFYEGDGYLLVNLGSGEQTYLAGLPTLSPDGRRFVVTSMDLEVGYNPNRIDIWLLGPGGPQLEWRLNSKRWGPGEATWDDERTVRLQKHFPGPTYDSDILVPSVLRLAEDGWRLEDE